MAEAGQDYVTICAPFKGRSERVQACCKQVEQRIEELGNPLDKELQAGLQKCGIVHFLSINVLPWDPIDRRAYLIIEAVVDGPAKPAIEKIVDCLEAQLFPIVFQACGLKNRAKLKQFLISHHRGLKQNYFNFSKRQIAGLPFNGKPGLSVAKIQRNRKISDEARLKLEELSVTSPNAGPITRFKVLKQHLENKFSSESNLDWCFSRENADELGFIDHQDAPWLPHRRKQELGLLTQLQLVVLGDVRMIVAAAFLILFLLYGYFLGLGFSTVIFQAIASLASPDWSLLGKGQFWTDILSMIACGDSCEGPASAFTKIATQVLSVIASLGLAAVTTVATLVTIGFLARWRLNWSESGDLRYLNREGFTGGEAFNPKRNYPKDLDPDSDLVARLMERENHPGYLQNHMYHAVPLIEGQFRRFTLMIGFRAVKHALTALGIMRPGFLGEVGTAHAVRWFIPPGSKRLVFCGNYDGNWESYLEAFITKAPTGTTAIWSNSQGFPKSKDLFLEGAQDGDRLKRYARRYMMPTLCWYSAYPHLTLEQIRRQAIIFNGLCLIGEDNSSNARAWLEMFDTVPRPESFVEDHNIQSLVFGNQSKLAHAAMLAVNFGEVKDDLEKQELKNWLYNEIVDPLVSFGNKPPEKRACYVAFGASGLEKLGLEELFRPRNETAPCPESGNGVGPNEFAPAFGLGMESKSRQRLLGDPDASQWQWGKSEKQADMVLLLYWCDATDRDVELENLRQSIISRHYSVIKELDISHKPGMENREPFGFRDGVSQPIVRGFGKDSGKENSIHLVEPGEFVLGYRDNRGYFPPSPCVVLDEEQAKTEVYLPALPDEMPQRYPSFSTQRMMRDFGRNGSYLVIRQIEQNVEEFQNFAQHVSKTLASRQNVKLSSDEVQALMIGRWKDGNPLATHPTGHAGSIKNGIENEYLYGSTDPQGRHCPFGAHIRRANPRDSLNPTSETELEVSNRHRILRRGRPYWNGEEGNDKSCGLLFMALNADIERQFEFIQSTWLNSSSFHGLEGERDPIFEHAGGKFTLPTDKGTCVFRGIQEFTTLQGGGYFFLPGRQALHYLTVTGKNCGQIAYIPQ